MHGMCPLPVSDSGHSSRRHCFYSSFHKKANILMRSRPTAKTIDSHDPKVHVFTSGSHQLVTSSKNMYLNYYSQCVTRVRHMHLWRSEARSAGPGSLLPPQGSWRCNSCYQAGQQAPFSPDHLASPFANIVCIFAPSSLCNPNKGNKQRELRALPLRGLCFNSQVDGQRIFDFEGNH